MRGKKKIILIAMGVIVVAAAVIIMLLVPTPHLENVNIERVNDSPLVVYQKLEASEEKGNIYSLNIGQTGGSPQKIASAVDNYKVSPDGKSVGFTIDNGGEYTRQLFLMSNDGTVRLVSDNIMYDDFQFAAGGTSICYHHGSRDILFIKEMDKTTEISGVGDYRWQISADGSAVVFTNRPESSNDTNGDKWGILSIYRNGETEKITEHVYLSQNNQCISNDGNSIIFVKDYEEVDAFVGTLYMKKGENEPEMIYEKSSMDIEISDDGNFIAAIVNDENGNDALLYKYKDEEPNIVEGISEFTMSDDGTTLVYTIDAVSDWDYELYSVKAGEEPVKLADHVVITDGVSEDGNTIAYFINLDKDEWIADLCVIREGIPELIDSNVSVSEYGGAVCLYKDGSIIAYFKNYGYMRAGDLYIKAEGQEKERVDVGIYELVNFLD